MRRQEYPKRPSYSEPVVVDFDEDTECHGVFGIRSGFCYALHTNAESAEIEAAKYNENRFRASRR